MIYLSFFVLLPNPIFPFRTLHEITHQDSIIITHFFPAEQVPDEGTEWHANMLSNKWISHWQTRYEIPHQDSIIVAHFFQAEQVPDEGTEWHANVLSNKWISHWQTRYEIPHQDSIIVAHFFQAEQVPDKRTEWHADRVADFNAHSEAFFVSYSDIKKADLYISHKAPNT
jgi:hypothetical protein